MKSQAISADAPAPIHGTSLSLPQKTVSIHRSALLWIIGYLAAGISLFFCYLHISDTQAVSADGASNVLQAWDILHGNVLMRGWTVSDVSFYTTELPEYVLVEVFRGLGPADVHVSAAVTYTLLVLLAGLLAKGRATKRAALLRVLIASGIMVAPEIGPGAFILLLSPDHTGTGVPLLVIWLLAEYAPRRPFTPVLVGLALAWATIGDTLVALMATFPIVVMCWIRVRQAAGQQHDSAQERRYNISLSIAAGASVPAAMLAIKAISVIGGYTVLQLRLGFMSSGSWWLNLRITAEGILGLYGADFTNRPLGTSLLVAVVHFIGLGLAAWGLLRGIRQIKHGESIIPGALSIAVVMNLLIFICSNLPHTLWDTREIAVTLPYGAVLAGRLLPGTLGKRAVRPMLITWAACYLFALIFALTYPSCPANDQDLATWLSRHHMTCGLSSYADGNTTTLDSGGRIQLRAPLWTSRGAYPGTYESKNTWFSPGTCDATFVVSTQKYGKTFYVPPSMAIKAFGKPQATYRYAAYTIMVWRDNLFARLRRPSPVTRFPWMVSIRLPDRAGQPARSRSTGTIRRSPR
jgi:hypothetical protein